MISVDPGRFDGFIFDCDGTLADSMPLHFRAWTDTLTRLTGAPSRMDQDLFYQLGGIPTRKIVYILNEKFGYTLDPEETAVEKEHRFLELLPEVQPIAPVLNFARKLGAQARRAVASGGSRHVVLATLQSLKLNELFPVLVTATDVLRGKPFPDLFLKAAECLGVSPERCLVFEDAPPGFEAARAAGMECIDVRPFYDCAVLPVPEA